ncbi:unnamed protein product (macronuclear) [Paramecium tetraurelia]|uniref:RRM domain-containing protein n=1 Tax=Paramecium tetraurelia TaxID=5888 RepID=A0CEI5_PARTE|nr:uncharacterized protein GSPATT00037640001 [Paramecium tetraurelia]CAK69202.1 unnamed protein product [Paramecium tetraurelia]|eukprot:XP_001436599.1 hypothetical protein (macronuclear) [Paramecium tetraurelia strain d4-2]
MALTKVVLLCIQNKKQLTITHDQIYKHFSQYGQIEKILIFEKTQIWKVFLETKNKETAQNLIKQCNNNILNMDNSLRMQLYPSNLENVTFSDSNSAGKDYSKSKEKRDSYNSTDDEQTSVGSQGEQNPNGNSTKSYQQQNIQQSIYQYQQHLQQRLYEQQVLQMRLQTQSLDLQVPDYVNTIVSAQWVDQFVQLGKLLQSQYLLQYQLIDNYINYIKQESANALSEIHNQQRQQQLQQQLQINNTLNQIYHVEQEEKSRVIVAKSFDDSVTTIDMLYNIFSIYGNIDKMVYQKDKSTLLVEYHLQKCADQCIEKLNNVVFQGQTLQITYSILQEITFLDELEELGLVEKTFYEERFIGSEATNRYKPKNSFVAASPNDTIFLMNLSDELLNIESIQPLLETEFVDYKFYEDPKQKHSCALKFKTVDDAMYFLAKNHGKVMADRKILMTFSKKPM